MELNSNINIAFEIIDEYLNMEEDLNFIKQNEKEYIRGGIKNMNNHRTVNININNQTIPVDEDLANTIIALNDLGYKTSGCCIGENGDEYEAWIVIQEASEHKMIELMKRLNDCCYTLTKEFYTKKLDDAIYVQYILKTPKGCFMARIHWVDDWFNKLSETVINPITSIEYKTMDKLFEKQWINISIGELCDKYKDNWEIQYKLPDVDLWLEYNMITSSLKSLIALNQMNAEWRYRIG
jgi:hypothetical protein